MRCEQTIDKADLVGTEETEGHTDQTSRQAQTSAYARKSFLRQESISVRRRKFE